MAEVNVIVKAVHWEKPEFHWGYKYAALYLEIEFVSF